MSASMEGKSRSLLGLTQHQTDLLVMFLFLCVGGNPLFSNQAVTLFLYAVIVAICLLRSALTITPQLLFWSAVYTVLFTLQFLFISKVSIPADLFFLIKLFVAYIVATSLGPGFRFAYFEVMTCLCAVSLVGFLINLVTFTGVGIPFRHYKTLFLYHSFLVTPEVRNCGMFWEPGAFQGYIMLVPLLYIDRLRDLWVNNRIPCLILVLTLVTTQSTTGYVAFFCFLLGYFAITIRNKWLSIGIVAALLGAGAFVFSKFDFLGTKLSEQYKAVIVMTESMGDQLSWTRMGSMLVDFENLKRHPIVGNGFLMDSKYGYMGELMSGAGNGFSGSANSLGVPVFLLTLYGFTLPLKREKPLLRALYLMTLVLVLNGEYFLNYVSFWVLLFIEFPKVTNNEDNCSVADGSQQEG